MRRGKQGLRVARGARLLLWKKCREEENVRAQEEGVQEGRSEGRAAGTACICHLQLLHAKKAQQEHRQRSNKEEMGRLKSEIII